MLLVKFNYWGNFSEHVVHRDLRVDRACPRTLDFRSTAPGSAGVYIFLTWHFTRNFICCTISCLMPFHISLYFHLRKFIVSRQWIEPGLFASGSNAVSCDQISVHFFCYKVDQEHPSAINPSFCCIYVTFLVIRSVSCRCFLNGSTTAIPLSKSTESYLFFPPNRSARGLNLLPQHTRIMKRKLISSPSHAVV